MIMSLSDTMYGAILRMRQTAKTKDKERVLAMFKNSVTFRRVLLQTYSPYIRYHIRKIPPEYVGKGTNEIDSSTWTLLNQLSLRTLTGTAARESLFEHLESLTPSANSLLRLIIKKDLKCGIATKTINRVYPGHIPTFECQLVDDWSSSRAKWPMLIGPKIDGDRGEFRSQMFTRRGKKVVGVNHITDYIRKIGTHMELSGELYVPGMSFHRSDGLIRSNKPSKPNVVYAVFDIPSLGSMPYDKRLDYLSKTFYPLGTKPQPPVVYIPHVMVDNEDQTSTWFHRWRSFGWEGLVGKNPNGFAKLGKGSYDWMRRVGGISAEYKIIDVYESEEVPGTMGGVIIEHGRTKVGSGFTPDERVKYWKNPSTILGKYATILAKEKTKAGSLRQPIFKNIRWDL